MSNVSLVVASNNGMYDMDGKSYSLDELMMALSMQRADTYEAQIVSQANEMKQRNERVKVLAGVMAALKGIEDGEKDWSNLYDANSQMVLDPKSQKEVSVKEFLQSEGIGMLESDKSRNSDWIWGAVERKEAIEKIKASIDSLNSQAQIDMIRLQGAVAKRDNAVEMASNLQKSLYKPNDSIVGNMR